MFGLKKWGTWQKLPHQDHEPIGKEVPFWVLRTGVGHIHGKQVTWSSLCVVRKHGATGPGTRAHDHNQTMHNGTIALQSPKKKPL